MEHISFNYIKVERKKKKKKKNFQKAVFLTKMVWASAVSKVELKCQNSARQVKVEPVYHVVGVCWR